MHTEAPKRGERERSERASLDLLTQSCERKTEILLPVRIDLQGRHIIEKHLIIYFFYR